MAPLPATQASITAVLSAALEAEYIDDGIRREIQARHDAVVGMALQPGGRAAILCVRVLVADLHRERLGERTPVQPLGTERP